MRECIDCRYSSPCWDNTDRYTCEKHGGKFDPFEHSACSDYREEDGSHSCYECDYHTTNIFGTDKCERTRKTICKSDRACPYFKEY